MKKCKTFAHCKQHAVHKSTVVVEKSQQYDCSVILESFYCTMCGRTFANVFKFEHTIDTSYDIDLQTQKEYHQVLDTERKIAP